MSGAKISLIFIGVFVFWALASIATFSVYSFDPIKTGPFGDTFGAVNALFTGLAFAGLIVTLRLQLQESHLARLEAHSNELAQQEQAKIMRETAQLNALIALADHSAKAYERAVELELPKDKREATAAEYDAHIADLRSFGREAKSQSEFGFREMEKEAGSRPVIEIESDGVSQAAKSGVAPNFNMSFRVKLNITNVTKFNITVRRVVAHLTASNGQKIDVIFHDSFDRNIDPNRGVIRLVQVANPINVSVETPPTLDRVVVQTVQQKNDIVKYFAEQPPGPI